MSEERERERTRSESPRPRSEEPRKESDFKVFVGGISWHTNDQELADSEHILLRALV